MNNELQIHISSFKDEFLSIPLVNQKKECPKYGLKYQKSKK